MSEINTDVNYKTMAGNARLLMLGESSHNTAGFKYEAIKALKQLKAAGFTHFAMEMLPRSMQEKIDFYQRTGKGFKVIQQYLNENWTWGYLVPKAYGELVKAARDIGLKVIALDISYELMEQMDKECEYDQYKTGYCFSTHTRRNKIRAEIIIGVLNASKQHRVVAFMHRWHAVQATDYEPGLDTIVQEKGMNSIRFIDFIGGITCLSQRQCEGSSAEINSLKQQYFSREGFPYKHAVKAFQVHIPEQRVNLDGTLKW